MTDTLINVRAPGCAGNLFLRDRQCPKCGKPVQITIQDVRGNDFRANCFSCGQGITGPLSLEEKRLINPNIV
jgi:hypothetical protein